VELANTQIEQNIPVNTMFHFMCIISLFSFHLFGLGICTSLKFIFPAFPFYFSLPCLLRLVVPCYFQTLFLSRSIYMLFASVAIFSNTYNFIINRIHFRRVSVFPHRVYPSENRYKLWLQLLLFFCLCHRRFILHCRILQLFI
jgi:hypothetical protein